MDTMIQNRSILLLLFLLILIPSVCSANVTDERIYFAEDTAIPFEVFVLMLGIGLVFLILAAMAGFAYEGGLTMVFGIVSTAFISVAAFAAPVTGFYSYVTNSTANASSQATPVVWLVMQPWMMWLVWGMATISFILFVFGILILFRDRKERNEMDWL